MAELSPAVERAEVSAREIATKRGDSVRVADWLTGLLQEEWGRPAELLGRLGLELEEIHAELAMEIELSPVAPDSPTLFDRARNFSLSLRGEPDLTTDFLMLAAIASDDTVQRKLARIGLSIERLEAALRIESAAVGEVAGLPGEEFVIADAPEVTNAARIVDANLNRARESLRVLDDYARFILDDAFLTGQFKMLRHKLADATALLPQHLLIVSRDTRLDVGTTLTAGGEYHRTSAAKVAGVNVKRLQESLRSLEEYGKVISVPFAKAVEAIRYEAYTLERVLVRGASVQEKLKSARLYVLLTGSQCDASLDWTIDEAASGGATVFQMREKGLTDRELLDRARRMRLWTRKAKALFIVNDRPDIAKLADADGVHLGQDDLSVAAARKIVGPDMLLGVSTHTIEQVRTAIFDGADYLGIGPTFPSTTKAFDTLAGLDFIRQVAAETTCPAFALGGITLSNVKEVIAAGCRRIAVSAAIAKAADPEATAMAFRQALSFGEED